MTTHKPLSVRLGQNQNDIQLLVHGQGVFLFEHTDINQPCRFTIYTKDKSQGISIEYTTDNMFVHLLPSNEPLIDTANTGGLTKNKGAYYWLSLDSQNQTIYSGIGESRMETVTYRYIFSNNDKARWEANKIFLESLVLIEIAKESTALKPIKLLRDPITLATPLYVRGTDDLTMTDIASGSCIPSSALSPISKQLYACVAGKKFVLDNEEFPDFSQAIEYSIATPGKWCYERLKQKATEFNKNPNIDETYLRITLGQNNGESPGIPYVMEIWPVGHYSPIHDHGGASAIIRVLHGSIHVSLYSYLCAEKEGITPFGTQVFKKDDITWISETLNKTHKLLNLPTNTETCITIQCYMYEGENMGHYDYFDYLDDNGQKQQYEPDSDMDFIEFKKTMKKEWLEQKAAN